MPFSFGLLTFFSPCLSQCFLLKLSVHGFCLSPSFPSIHVLSALSRWRLQNETYDLSFISNVKSALSDLAWDHHFQTWTHFPLPNMYVLLCLLLSIVDIIIPAILSSDQNPGVFRFLSLPFPDIFFSLYICTFFYRGLPSFNLQWVMFSKA